MKQHVAALASVLGLLFLAMPAFFGLDVRAMAVLFQMPMLWICAAAAIVFGAIVRSIMMASPSNSSPDRSPLVRVREVAWAVIPIVIVVAAAAPAIRNSRALRNFALHTAPQYVVKDQSINCGAPNKQDRDAAVQASVAHPCPADR